MSTQPQFGNLPPGRCYVCPKDTKPRWAWRNGWVCLNCEASKLPPNWGLVNGKPFTLPLPDGKPVEMAESMRLRKTEGR